jgi:hypothetical protein
VADALSCYPTTSASSSSSTDDSTSASEDQRLAGALLLGALLKASPDKFAPYAPQVRLFMGMQQSAVLNTLVGAAASAVWTVKVTLQRSLEAVVAAETIQWGKPGVFMAVQSPESLSF